MTARVLAVALITLYSAHAGGHRALAVPPLAPTGAFGQPDTGGPSPIGAAPPRLLFSDADGDDDSPRDNPSGGTAVRTPPPAHPARDFFGWLDDRSSYGKDFFPDPFLGPEFDRETQFEVDDSHAQDHAAREDEVDVGFQWNALGQLTLAGEAGWSAEQRTHEATGDAGSAGEPRSTRGFEAIDLAMYHPIFQRVSAAGTWDYTAALRLDVGVPTNTAVSGRNVLLTPFLGQLLRVGQRVSLETWIGPRFALAPHQNDELVYGAAVGYRLTHNELPCPLTKAITPLLELDGTNPIAGHGNETLTGVLGFTCQFAPLGELDPRISVGYEFPLDGGAREELQWGVVSQFFLEF